MAYTVGYSDSTKTAININDGELDNTTDITLLGKNYARYGQIVAEDLLHMLENFASGTAPTSPTEGQLWYDTATNSLNYRDADIDGQWRSLGQMTVIDTAPSILVQEGHLWLNSATGQLSIYYAGSWVSLGTTGNTNVRASSRLDTDGTLHSTLETLVNGVIVSIACSDTTPWQPNASIGTEEFLEDGTTLLNTVFPTIQPGINLNNTADFVFNGTATSAQYADLAERYWADALYTPGHVVELGGEKEITQSTTEGSTTVFGVVSTRPGLMLNAGAGTDETHPFVALAGRVPCKVIGTAQKGDRLVTSSTPGYARAVADGELVDWTQVIGRAIETKITDKPGSIEVVVGTK